MPSKPTFKARIKCLLSGTRVIEKTALDGKKYLVVMALGFHPIVKKIRYFEIVKEIDGVDPKWFKT